jgi:dUTP pyrophosphatase
VVRIGKFEKVSYNQFSKDIKDTFGDKYFDAQIKYMYDDIILPCRSTIGSAGYDFKSPFEFTLEPNQTIKIPSSI